MRQFAIKIAAGALAVLAQVVAPGMALAASNEIRINAPISQWEGEWLATDPLVEPWEDTSALYDCKKIFPTADYYYKGVAFEQTHSNCSLDQTQKRQNQVINSRTGDVRSKGEPYVVTRTRSDLSYTTQEIGASTTYSVIMNAGRHSSTSYGSFVGMYARVNSGVNIGSPVFTPDGDRVMIYYGKSGVIEKEAACTIRLGVSLPAGWTPGGVATQSSLEFGKQANVLTLYGADGQVAKVYNFPAGHQTSDAGFFRSTTADCSEMRAFYNDLGYFTKATLTP